ncbi:MAG: hemolysin family protein [Ruminococcus sp.]|nr:hemolysin family protein [Ruminococcus sp.]
MDDVGRLWQGFVICAVIIILMFFFTVCENAIIEINDSKLKKLTERTKHGKHLRKLVEKPNRLVMTNLISRAIMIIVLSASTTAYFFGPLRKRLMNIFSFNNHQSRGYFVICILTFFIIICILALVITVFGINLPKRLCSGGKISNRFILNASGIYRAFLLVFLPLEIIASGITTALLKLFGIKTGTEQDSVTEEEILMMVDAVNETGGIEESQAEMISNIFEFDDLEISDVMTHRTDVVAVEINSPVEQAVELAINEGFSRIPVYEDTIDNICGVIFAKDLLKLVLSEKSEKMKLKDFMREIKYVPESNSCGELFEYFTSQKNHIAVVVDEYGGTAGIVTMEDLLESIVGNIQDEYDDEDEEIQEITPNTFDLLGSADPEEVMEILGKKLPDNEDYDTIGGFVTDLLGYIPEDGQTPEVAWENIEFSVIKTKDKRIEKLRAVIKKHETVTENE